MNESFDHSASEVEWLRRRSHAARLAYLRGKLEALRPMLPPDAEVAVSGACMAMLLLEEDIDRREADEKRLRSALDRLYRNAQHIFDQKSVRDWDETLHEAAAALRTIQKEDS